MGYLRRVQSLLVPQQRLLCECGQLTHMAHSAGTRSIWAHSVRAHRQELTAGLTPESQDPLNQTWPSDKNLLVICLPCKSLQSPNLRHNKECIYFILVFFSKILSKFN